MSTPSSSTQQPSTSQQAPAAPFVAYPLAAGQQPQIQPQASASGEGKTQPQTRLAAEAARKDRTLAEFMLMLDDYEPLIPDEVTDYYLQRAGVDCQDARLCVNLCCCNRPGAEMRGRVILGCFRKRLLALAAQKFVSDIAADAYQHARIRTNATGGRARGNQPGSSRDKTRTTLTMDDLSSALAEYGINSRKPEFYM
ncbi:transcription initiation factor IID, TAF10 subunit [Artomyces pyxidatus]|uniref:Transcription initiation factor IID, TAF10 subunit n=1 Tax=Artomyces pyxidatus TaxID=48021 RepID=A0ACB8SWZ8_9AGAM|nr:transcription initiation factor IID, TAF10 subunit [Artomyces pyxidatus]